MYDYRVIPSYGLTVWFRKALALEDDDQHNGHGVPDGDFHRTHHDLEDFEPDLMRQ
jgi:hypothetical protein